MYNCYWMVSVQFRFWNFCGRSCQRFCNYDFPHRVSDEIPWKIKSL